MKNAQLPPKTTTQLGLEELVLKINETLIQYSDKDWNYSRISLITSLLNLINGPYALWADVIDSATKQGQEELKRTSEEMKWGEHHSGELGILEIISLRVNKALQQVSNDEFWGKSRPILRITRKEHLALQEITHAIWYEIAEVGGEEFDSR